MIEPMLVRFILAFEITYIQLDGKQLISVEVQVCHPKQVSEPLLMS